MPLHRFLHKKGSFYMHIQMRRRSQLQSSHGCMEISCDLPNKLRVLSTLDVATFDQRFVRSTYVMHTLFRRLSYVISTINLAPCPVINAFPTLDAVLFDFDMYTCHTYAHQMMKLRSFCDSPLHPFNVSSKVEVFLTCHKSKLRLVYREDYLSAMCTHGRPKLDLVQPPTTCDPLRLTNVLPDAI